MKYKPLGNTGLLVSEFCLGTMTFGGKNDPMSSLMGALELREASKIIEEALEAGINFIDTANVYGLGESEEIIGETLKQKRHDVVIATKVGFRMGSGANQVGLSRKHIIREVEESLRRLQTDYIDLLQIHRPDSLTEWEEILRVLDDLVTSGKVRYTGASNLQGWQIMKANETSSRLGLGRFKSFQSYYSLVGREAEREIIPVIKDQNMGLLIWSPLAGGFLTGKYVKGTEGVADGRRMKFQFPPVHVEKGYEILGVLEHIAQFHQSTVPQIALAWLLHQPAVTSVILGAKRPEQLRENLGAADIVLTNDQLLQIDEVSKLQPEYPLWDPTAYTADRYPI
ncbi:aldo/keto reductase [Paenibacillus sp. 1-18]|uniref:aldo/keto reductase n=1 Tax=Paenibacillus sp. 1-18 TaxID=1333846 RepID=UPI000470556F|nr:aldo/keto reductase [Paenibacillus sp. 1-18]